MARRSKTTAPLRPLGKLPSTICPFCRKPIEVMPSGLLALHPVKGRWSSSMCRGSGAVASLNTKQ